jgi:hypothetical protein
MVKKQINVVHLSEVKPVEDNQDERELIKQTIEQEEQLVSDATIQEEVPKQKPKRKSPTKKAKLIEHETEPVHELPEEVDTVIETTPKEIIKQPDKKIKTVELYKCDKCNKEMTQRALRYTHPQYCVGKEIKRNDVPVKRQAKPIKMVSNVVEITPDIIENHLRTVKEHKLKERQEKISKLVAKIV